MIIDELLEKVKAVPGKIGFYYATLDGSEKAVYNGELPLIAASVIKIPIMIEAFRRFESGEASPDEIYVLKEEDKMPSCGALNRMHAGLEITLRDLVELMIVLSDNTATNILIERFGVESVNRTLNSMGVHITILRRKLFDMVGYRAGINNYICAEEIGHLLEMMYRGECISESASSEMLEILKNQKLNGKFPFYLHAHDIKCAHKTGEDDGTSHDVGIIYSGKPFVLCMVSNETDVPSFERFMQDAAWELAQHNA